MGKSPNFYVLEGSSLHWLHLENHRVHDSPSYNTFQLVMFEYPQGSY